MTTPKPPVPSARELAEKHGFHEHSDYLREIARQFTEDGREHTALRVASHTDALVVRIAELEAEVAELREKLERADAELHQLRAPRSVTIHVPEATGSPEDDTSALLAAFDAARSYPPRGDWWLVRRTPELTERVAAYFEAKGCTRGYAGELALGFLDLVFGKKDE